MSDLKIYLIEQLTAYLEAVPESVTTDTYALSVFVSHESDMGIQDLEISIGVHTEGQVKERLERSGGGASEARWNFLEWGDPFEKFEWGMNNYKTILGVDRDHKSIAIALREDWLRNRSLLGIEEEDFDSFEDYLFAEESGIDRFRQEVAEACLSLRERGVITRVFGDHEVLIAIHGVCDNFLENQPTKLANPNLEQMILT